MSSNTRLVTIAIGCILVLSCIFYIVSNAVPNWSQTETVYFSFTYGLWQSCAAVQGSKTCVALQCPTENDDRGFCSKIFAGRAFVTLACILSGISSICLFFCAWKNENTNRILLFATKGLVLASLITGILGVAIGASTTQTAGQSGITLTLGAGAIIGIVAIIVNFVGAVGSLFIKT